jgi:hypothetical protein
MVIAVLLIYTATYMPYKTCFVDESTPGEEALDWVVDGLFMFDIFVNFVTAIENRDGTENASLKTIAATYLRSWFIFDLLSVLPFQLIEKFIKTDENAAEESGGNYNQLIRLARLPRLYRLTKLVRLFKILKSAKNMKFL